MGVALSNFTRTHAWVSQMVRNDMRGVSGCDAGRQRDKPRRKQATVIVSKRRFDGMVFEHCSSTTIESRRWQKPRHLVPDKTMSWQLGDVKKQWDWFHQPCARVRIVSLVCLEMMSLALQHILSGWLLRPLLVSVNISVIGVVCFQSREAIFRSICLKDRSAEETRGFAMVAMGLFHVEVVMS